MKKRLFAFVLCLTLAMNIAPITALAVQSHPFQDVPTNHWANEAVQYVYAEKLMTGISAETFNPNGTLTRAQVCQILYNMEGNPKTKDTSFSDVSPSAWYYSAVAWASNCGIVSGVGNNKFNPTMSITREQFATVLYRFAQYKEYSTDVVVSLLDFKDSSNVSDWADLAVGWAVGIGVISGVSEGNLVPQGTATRAQAATMFMRFCQRSEDELAFKEKNVKDFQDQDVIKFEDSTETNFAVLSENATLAKTENNVNQIEHIDSENGIYTFSNINDEISELSEGDILYLPYNNSEPVLLKVGKIEITGNTAVITACDADLTEYFDYIDLDMEIGIDAEDIDTSTKGANVFIAGDGLSKDGESVSLQGLPENIRTLLFSLKEQNSIGGSPNLNINVGYYGDTFSAAAEMTLTLTAKISYDKWIWENPEIYVSLKQETVGEISVKKNFTGKAETVKVPVGSLDIPLGTSFFVADFDISLFFNVNSSVEGSVRVEYTSEIGQLYKDGASQPISLTDNSTTVQIVGDFEAATGLYADGGISLKCIGAQIKVLLAVEGGFHAKGTAEKDFSVVSKEEKHLCVICVPGYVAPYCEIDFKIQYGFGSHLKTLYERNLAQEEGTHLEFYISLLNDESLVEFGWGKCPHKEYVVSISVKDENGKPIPGVMVTLHNETTGILAASGRTDEGGIYACYCRNGSYKATVVAENGYENSSPTIIAVNNRPTRINIFLKEEAGDSGIPQLGSPEELGWGRVYWWNSSTEGTVLPGSIYWKKAWPDQNVVRIKYYRQGQKDPVDIIDSMSYEPDSHKYRSFESFLFGDFDSGTYYFTIESLGDGVNYCDSAIAVSEPWTYVKPDEKLPVCTQLTWDWPNATWAGIDDDICGYWIGFYFSETLDEEPEEIGHNWSNSLECVMQIESDWIQTYGCGYYSFRVRALSNDITEVQSSPLSSFSDFYYLSEM